MARIVELETYNPSWPEKYNQESQQIGVIFASEMISIHHIGSTAITGIKAKPVIDMMVVVQEIDKVEDFNQAMIQFGYTPRGEYGIPGRRYFIKSTQGVRSYHVHVYPQGHKNISQHLNFRDYLRAHSPKALAYVQLKEKLARQFREDPFGYSEAKSDFIEKINQLAAKWREQQESGAE